VVERSQAVPVTKRPEGSYQVAVSVGGRTLRRSSRHWSFKDARKVESDLLAQARRLAAGEKPERTLTEGLEEWLTKHVPKLRSERQSRNHARMLLPYLKGKRLSEAPQVWADLKAKMKGKAPATVNHKGRILRQICNLALTEWGWTDVPIGKRIKLLPETPREIFLTPEQVEALAVAAKGDAGDLILFAAWTGIRLGHMLRLTQHDIRGGFVTLDRTSKTRSLQQVPIAPRIEAIAARLPLPVSEWQLRQAWTAARKECGLQAVRWHDLRHTCASWLVQNGVPLLAVRDWLGHSTVAVTQRYAHLAPMHLRDAASRLPVAQN
jgi:integrase